MAKEKNKSPSFKLKVDIQCGVCSALIHIVGTFPLFCTCCGAGLERFCLKCHMKAELYFEEWWPQDDECLRTYSPAKRCGRCNAILGATGSGMIHNDNYQN